MLSFHLCTRNCFLKKKVVDDAAVLVVWQAVNVISWMQHVDIGYLLHAYVCQCSGSQCQTCESTYYVV